MHYRTTSSSKIKILAATLKHKPKSEYYYFFLKFCCFIHPAKSKRHQSDTKNRHLLYQHKIPAGRLYLTWLLPPTAWVMAMIAPQSGRDEGGNLCASPGESITGHRFCQQHVSAFTKCQLTRLFFNRHAQTAKKKKKKKERKKKRKKKGKKMHPHTHTSSLKRAMISLASSCISGWW